MLRWIAIVLLAPSSVFAQTCAVIPVDATDGAIVAPENYKVLFENSDVRVLEVIVLPHTKEAMHTHARPAILYVDSTSSGRYITPENPDPRPQPASKDFKFAIFNLDRPEPLHAVENIGDVPFHAIRVELKHPGCSLPPASPMEMPGPSDALIAAPASHTLLLDTPDMRVLDIHIAAGEKEPMHTHPWPGIFYLIQGAPTRYFTSQNANPKVDPTPPAAVKVVALNAQGLHSLQNMGTVTAHSIRFEPKHPTLSEYPKR